jgi:hypothetical protein
MLQKFTAALRSERGSIEAAMVLIPLLVLFLVGAQLALTAHSRNVASNSAQNDASVRGISGAFVASDRFLHLESSGDGQNLDLLVTQRNESLISLIPTFSLLEGRFVAVHGIAIVENRR